MTPFFYRTLLIILVVNPTVYVQSWGFEAHKRINEEAVKLLPDSIGEYYQMNIHDISDHAVDPDLWKKNDSNEGYGHYIDADYYDEYPFDNIPRNLNKLYSSFGTDNVQKWGIAPWRIEEYFKNLIDQLQQNNWEKAILTSAALGHYVADIHMPLHVVSNYNGQFTGNTGIHAQWETQMVNKYLLDAIVPSGSLFVINDPVEISFVIVSESYTLHTELLRADSLARTGLTFTEIERLTDWRDPLDDLEYHKILYRESGDIAKQRMEAAAVRVASFWYSAWVEAGKPLPPGKK